ncbi:MAG: sterol-binding protein [Proteobacteria bacterium]|nr:sterol-binding protein [Pseudomonadota bacterium]
MKRLMTGLAALLVAGTAAAEDPVLMSAAWGAQACSAWNADPVLTGELASSGWIENDKGRGFKVMQVYRSDCSETPTVELRVSLQDGKARCVYGGEVETAKPDSGADYVMHAETRRWQEMGAAEYGPMKAMMFGRLKFSGPYGEAMGNMGPFTNFLLLVGKVPARTDACP